MPSLVAVGTDKIRHGKLIKWQSQVENEHYCRGSINSFYEATFTFSVSSVYNISTILNPKRGMASITFNTRSWAPCNLCQRNNKKLKKAAGTLHPIPGGVQTVVSSRDGPHRATCRRDYVASNDW